MARRRSAEDQAAIRSRVFDWLDQRQRRGQFEFSHVELKSFEYRGTRIPLLDQGRGIRNPVDFDATLTVMTTAKAHPYGDEIEADGRITYSFQSRDGGDNVKLLRAAELDAPLVYFKGVRDGVYIPYFPVVIDEVDLDRRVVKMRELSSAVDFYPGAIRFDYDGRRYGERVVRTRQHQKAFRAKVLHAYSAQCAICRLNKPDLLDAAHIIGDAEEAGVPETFNGLSMCSLHHSAYDANLLGIDSRLRVHVSRELTRTKPKTLVDATFMNFAGSSIVMPEAVRDRPNVDALAHKFGKYRSRQLS